MRKVVASTFVTLDGVFEDPGGAEGFELGGWSFKYSGRSKTISGTKETSCARATPSCLTRHLPGLRQGVAGDEGRGLVSGEDEQHAQIRRVLHAAQG